MRWPEMLVRSGGNVHDMKCEGPSAGEGNAWL